MKKLISYKNIKKYIEFLLKNEIDKNCISIFEYTNDIIYILLPKNEFQRLFTQINNFMYKMQEKYSNSIYIDSFDNFYDSEDEIKEEKEIKFITEIYNVDDILSYNSINTNINSDYNLIKNNKQYNIYKLDNRIIPN
ncbi:hypothetical protein [Brachyspira pilosicoli]|uniref:hypothetical protein n=1 Tax=Brachyspira pilosicoli TaxID=52584 RepID=UPI0030076A74